MSVIFVKILQIRYGQTKVLKRLRDRLRRLEEFSDSRASLPRMLAQQV